MEKEKVFLKIRTILNHYDPAGVISDVDNPDEYDLEVDKIINMLTENISQEILADGIYRIFVECFDQKIAGDRKKYDQIASKILEGIK